MPSSSRRLTFVFSGTWAQFRPVFKAMRGIKGSFFRVAPPTRFYRNEAGILEEYREEKL